MTLAERIAEIDEGVLLADGLEDAFIGLVQTPAGMVAAYSVEKVLEILHAQGASMEEAQEHFDFNIAGAYVGERTPLYVMELPPEGWLGEE